MTVETTRRACVKAWSKILFLAALGACTGHAALAQEIYPSRPIRLIVPFPPGGAVDVYARIIQQALSKELGQTVVVDNRTGASGMIGTEAVVSAAPDGYTLALGNVATFAINSAIYKNMQYDPVKDLTPIVKTVVVNYVLVVNPAVPVKTAAELIAYAKAHPGTLTYGSSGSGSAQHMAAEAFKGRTGIDMLHVPYKGTGALLGDLIAGHVNVLFADQGTMMPQVKAGKLRVLGVGGLTRVKEYPDIPTIAESANLPGYEAVAWQGLAGPARMPAAVTRRLNLAINKIQADPAIEKQLAQAGLTPAGGSADDFGKYIRAEVAKWGKIAKDVGVAVE